MADTLFPIANAEEYLRPSRPGMTRSGNALQWGEHDGRTELKVEPLNYKTHDDRLVSERVTLSHTCDWMDRMKPEDAQAMNKWATLSAFLPADSNNRAFLVCKVDIFSTDRDAAERVYAPLLCTEAAVLGWHAARMGRRQLQLNSEYSPLHQTNETPPFNEEAITKVMALSDSLGFVGSRDKDYFCVEFPWDPGAVTRQFAWPDVRERLLAEGKRTEEELDQLGGATSLLTITTNQQHALYGNGVLCRLEIPVEFDETTATPLVDQLNRWELSGFDLPPLFGAWCMGPRAPTFVTFIPNQYCVPGLLQNLFSWMLVRHSRVRDWLTSSQSRN